MIYVYELFSIFLVKIPSNNIIIIVKIFLRYFYMIFFCVIMHFLNKCVFFLFCVTIFFTFTTPNIAVPNNAIQIIANIIFFIIVILFIISILVSNVFLCIFSINEIYIFSICCIFICTTISFIIKIIDLFASSVSQFGVIDYG